MDADDEDLNFRLARAKSILQALRNKSWTRVYLAQKSGYDERTIRNLLKGTPVRDQTVIDVCKLLDIEPELEDASEYVDAADDRHGGYTRTPFRKYEGIFLGYKRSFKKAGCFVRNFMSVTWDEDAEVFRFGDHFRYKHRGDWVERNRTGEIFISPMTDLLHFLLVDDGSVRLATLMKMRGREEIMRGTIASYAQNVMFFQPANSAFLLEKSGIGDVAQLMEALPRLVEPGQDGYVDVKNEIEFIERDILFNCRNTDS